MCLTINKKIPSLTKEDIIVYKLIEQDPVTNEYQGFYQNRFKINLKELYHVDFDEFEIDNKQINSGFHAFNDLLDIINNIDEFGTVSCGKKGVIVKCIIPKETKCFVGEWNGYYFNCIVSESIIYDEIVWVGKDDTRITSEQVKNLIK